MQFLDARALAVGLALAAACHAGCGDDGGGNPDGGGPPDAAPDAEDLCPGQLTFEALVADAELGAAVFDVDVAEVGGSATASSAPNGRVFMCLPSGSDSQLRSDKADYLVRLENTTRDAVEPTLGTDQPYPIDVLSADAADELVSGLGLTRDPAATLLLVSVVSYPDAEPLVGATVSIDVESGGAFARDAAGQFALSPESEIGPGRLLLFANAALSGGEVEGRAAVVVTPPEGFTGTCAGPASVELEPGGLSGAFFACR